MADDKLHQDLDSAIADLKGVHEFLDTLYYSEKGALPHTQTKISLLLTGVDFVTTNLTMLHTELDPDYIG